MFYIVGLGNPGAAYKKTRHNAGWWVLDALISAWELPAPRLVKKYNGVISEGLVQGEPVTLLYPQTFMNNSGVAVRSMVPKGASEQLILIYDDVDLLCGQVRVSFGNGSGGHNGVRSVIDTLGTKDFVRVRIGVAAVGEETGHAIRPTGDELAAYVLAKITPAETAVFTQLMPLMAEIVGTIITDGKEKAMNRWN